MDFSVGLRVVHQIHGAGVIQRIVKVYSGRVWLVVKLDSGEVQPRPAEEWHREAMD